MKLGSRERGCTKHNGSGNRLKQRWQAKAAVAGRSSSMLMLPLLMLPLPYHTCSSSRCGRRRLPYSVSIHRDSHVTWQLT